MVKLLVTSDSLESLKNVVDQSLPALQVFNVLPLKSLLALSNYEPTLLPLQFAILFVQIKRALLAQTRLMMLIFLSRSFGLVRKVFSVISHRSIFNRSTPPHRRWILGR